MNVPGVLLAAKTGTAQVRRITMAERRSGVLSNVVMTPHMGSATWEGRVASGEKVIANIRMWADGHRPRLMRS